MDQNQFIILTPSSLKQSFEWFKHFNYSFFKAIKKESLKINLKDIKKIVIFKNQKYIIIDPFKGTYGMLAVHGELPDGLAHIEIIKANNIFSLITHTNRNFSLEMIKDFILSNAIVPYLLFLSLAFKAQLYFNQIQNVWNSPKIEYTFFKRILQAYIPLDLNGQVKNVFFLYFTKSQSITSKITFS